MQRLIAGVVLIMLFAAFGVASGDEDEVPHFRCRWLAPSEGGAVDYYEVEIRELYMNRVDTLTVEHDASQDEQIFEFDGLVTDWEASSYIVRVRGVNAAGTGPWTDFSNSIEPAFQDDPEP